MDIGVDPLSDVLQKVHAKNLATYQRLLQQQTQNEATQALFWDIVVVTAGDVQQRRSYEHRIDLKLKQGRLPCRAKYHVIEDPPQSRMGSGGATCQAMKILQEQYPMDFLAKARTLLVHAGGYSTRLPHISARGKIFTTLPQADHLEGIQVLELKLVLYLHLLETMPPGVFLTSADGIELFASGTPFPSEPKPFTITALAHPSSTRIGSTHGVYLLQDADHLVTRDRKLHPKDQSAFLLKCQRFLHKPSLEVMKSVPGVIYPGSKASTTDIVYTDSCYYFDPQTATLMANMFPSLDPKCDLEAWADILDFQDIFCATHSSIQQPTSLSSDPHILGRQLVKRSFQKAGVSLDVMVLNASKFYHLGTMQEFLDGTCTDVAFMRELNIRNMVAGMATVFALEKVDLAEYDSTSNIRRIGNLDRGAYVSPPVYIENSILAPEVHVGPHSIVIDSDLPNRAVLPGNCCLFTLQIHQSTYVTFTFSVNDDMKKSVKAIATAETALKDLLFIFERVPISRMLHPNTTPSIESTLVETQRSEGLSLWNAPVFEMARTRHDSISLALDRLDRIRSCISETHIEEMTTSNDRSDPSSIVGWVSLKDAARMAREFE
ncbi:hypothetical protein BGX28_004253 [Mortierella sp. GBA30]|nr:hypothetical protein BGX28_004253 [Mortierella sp. GBA30]